MATTLKESKFGGSNGSHFKIRLSYDLSQSQANNTSTIKYYLYMISMDGYSGSGATAKGYINGSQVGTFTSIGVNTTKEIGTKTVTVTHNNDGTKSVSYSASVDTPWSLGDASLSGTLTLPTIKRQANITSAPDFTDEENPTITYTNPLGNSVTGLVACISLTGEADDISYRDIPKTGTSYTFELTEAERNVLRQATTNSTSRSIKFFVRTNINGTNYYSSLQRTLTIVNANPTQTVSVTETNQNVISVLGNDSTATYVVQNASELQFASTPSTLKYATVKNVSLYHNGTLKQTITTSPYSFTPTKAETNAFNVITTDSRNLQANNEVKWTANYIEYIPIDITQYSFKRYNPTSSNIVLNATIKYKQTTFKNTANVPTIKWKVGEEGTLNTISSSDYTIDTTNDTITITNLILSNVLSYQSSEEMYLYANDLLTEDTEHFLVTKGIPTIDAGEHDFKVNGELYIADRNGENAVDVGKAIEKNIISVGLNSNVTLSSTGQIVTSPNKIISQVGDTNKLYLDTNGLYIGEDVNHIMLSGMMQIHSDTATGSPFNISIYKNGSEFLLSLNSGRTTNTNYTKSITPRLVEVSEGDYFQFGFYGSVRDYINSDAGRTYITVEVVD